MYGITSWKERKLGLKVNMAKTKITKPNKLKYLGFGFYYELNTKTWKLRAHEESIKKFKERLKRLTIRKYSIRKLTI